MLDFVFMNQHPLNLFDQHWPNAGKSQQIQGSDFGIHLAGGQNKTFVSDIIAQTLTGGWQAWL